MGLSKSKTAAICLTLVAALSSCSSKEKAIEAATKSNAPSEPALNPALMNTTQATAMSGGSDFTMINFKHGSDQLTEASQKALRTLAKDGQHQTRAMSEVKVLAWADREYPEEKTKASKSDLALADRRAASIKKFMKDDLKLSVNIDQHNMAKRPGLFSEMIKTDDYKIKNNFEGTGAAPTAPDEKYQRVMDSKVSKAVVFIKYK